MFLVLDRNYLKKLKIILQYNWIFYIIFISAIIYCAIYNSVPHSSKYNVNDNSFKIVITDINRNLLFPAAFGTGTFRSSYGIQ